MDICEQRTGPPNAQRRYLDGCTVRRSMMCDVCCATGHFCQCGTLDPGQVPMRQQSRNNVTISFGSSSGMLWMICSVLFAFRNADVVLGAVGWGQNQPDSVGGAIVAGPFSGPVNDQDQRSRMPHQATKTACFDHLLVYDCQFLTNSMTWFVILWHVCMLLT